MQYSSCWWCFGLASSGIHAGTDSTIFSRRMIVLRFFVCQPAHVVRLGFCYRARRATATASTDRTGSHRRWDRSSCKVTLAREASYRYRRRLYRHQSCTALLVDCLYIRARTYRLASQSRIQPHREISKQQTQTNEDERGRHSKTKEKTCFLFLGFLRLLRS
jgi:hypothetical protein